MLAAKLAITIRAIDDDLVIIDAQIAQHLCQHEAADFPLSMPGFGPTLAATFLAQIGGSLHAFETADRLASIVGLAPVPRDSGRISGNLHRPRRFNRRLLRTCYLAALSSLKNSPSSRVFYDRKRAEGKSHKQAVIALARRRMNVIWAMLRDHTAYVGPPSHPASCGLTTALRFTAQQGPGVDRSVGSNSRSWIDSMGWANRRWALKDRLAKKWSPQQISSALRSDYPHDPGMRLATESIYTALYRPGTGLLTPKRPSPLRTGRDHRHGHVRPVRRRAAPG